MSGKIDVDITSIVLLVIALTWCTSTIVDVARGRAHATGCGCFKYTEDTEEKKP
jgi:hypothetical protein